MLFAAILFAIVAAYLSNFGFAYNDREIALFCFIMAATLAGGYYTASADEATSKELEALRKRIEKLEHKRSDEESAL